MRGSSRGGVGLGDRQAVIDQAVLDALAAGRARRAIGPA